jgi:hypothetical protein
MLKTVVNFLNLKLGLLNYFDLTRCLSELKVDSEGKTSPKEYISNGNWDNIDFDAKDGVSYWRLRDEIATIPIESIYKAGKRVEVTIPLKLVFSVPRRKLTEDDAYSFDRIRQTISRQFNIDDGDLKNTLGCEKVEISSPTANGDAKDVWDAETENTGTHEPNYNVVFGSVDIDVKLIYKGSCLPTECEDVDSDILHSFDFCSAAVRDRLTDAQVTCLEDALCGVCAGVTYTNSDGSYSGTEPSGGTLNIPNITVTDSDGSTSSVPSVQDIVCTPCTTPTLIIGVFSDAGHTTPITDAPFGATIYLKATATYFTPEGYIFYAVDANGIIFAIGVEQVGDSTSWIISATGDIQIGCIASPHAPTESERRWYGESQDFEVSADSDAVAFITAVETESSLTMDALQKSVLDTFYLMFKGVGTTNSSDLWTLATSSNAVLFGYIPISNSVATASGFKIDMLNPANFCTFAGFISGDFLPSGLTGGTGKYSRLTVKPSNFGQDDISLAVFSKTDVASTNKAIGSTNGSSEVSIIKKHSSLSGKSVVRINHAPTAYAYTNLSVDSDSNLLATRKISSAVEYSVDGVAQSLTANGSQTSLTPNAQEIYAHAFNNNGTAASYDSGTFTGFAVMPSMTVAEKEDFQECIDYLNANIITGGR